MSSRVLRSITFSRIAFSHSIATGGAANRWTNHGTAGTTALSTTLSPPVSPRLPPRYPTNQKDCFISDEQLRTAVFVVVPRDMLIQTLQETGELVRPADQVFYQDLQKQHRRV
jgi:hypothetical protein